MKTFRKNELRKNQMFWNSCDIFVRSVETRQIFENNFNLMSFITSFGIKKTLKLQKSFSANLEF